MSENTQQRDCEECSFCVTINEDRDNFCRLQQRVVFEVCEKFDDVNEPDGDAAEFYDAEG